MSALPRRAMLALAALPAMAHAAEPLSLRAADGVQVFGTLVPAVARRRGTLLLFHMAGSNRGEYAPIQPELARQGFDSLAIDQRSGGTLWGQRNETAAALGRDPGYAAALPDLRAALAWARQRDASGPVLLWGSSYSAALVFLLAAEAGPAVNGLLSFSPGEYLSGISVRAAAARCACPAFVTSASDSEEVTAAERLLAAVTGTPKRQFRPRQGLHGSATLRADRNPGGAAGAWAAVNAFLAEVVPA
jgi:pimeloyl-ACP methyl ester carboxylesterase